MLARALDVACAAGAYLLRSGRAERCVACTSRIVCDDVAHRVLERLYVKRGFWRQNDRASTIRECPNAAACRAGAVFGDAACHRGHEGPLCAVCARGYTPDGRRGCARCTARDALVAAASFLGGCCCLVLLAYAIVRDEKRRAVLLRFVRARDVESFKMKMKIVFVVEQILASLPSVLPGVNYPRDLERFFGLLAVLEFQLFGLFNVCVPAPSYHAKLLAATLPPLAVVAALFAWYEVEKRWRGRDGRKAFTYVIVFTYVCFPTISSILFQCFAEDRDFDFGAAYLRVDYGQRADARVHRRVFRPLAVVMILIWTFGVPAMYAFVLLLRRSYLDPDRALVARWVALVLAEKATEARAKPPPAPKRPARRNSSAYAAKRRDDAAYRALVGDTHARIAQLDDLLADERHAGDTSIERQRAFLVERLVVALRHEVPAGLVDRVDINTCEFLWGPYKPRFYWWELVECARRVVLSAVLLIVVPGSVLQVALGLLVASSVTVLECYCQPYADDSNNEVAFGANCVLSLTFFAALLLSDEFDAHRGQLLGHAVVAINACMIAVCFEQVRRDCLADVPWSAYASHGARALVDGARDAFRELEDLAPERFRAAIRRSGRRATSFLAGAAPRKAAPDVEMKARDAPLPASRAPAPPGPPPEATTALARSSPGSRAGSGDPRNVALV